MFYQTAKGSSADKWKQTVSICAQTAHICVEELLLMSLPTGQKSKRSRLQSQLMVRAGQTFEDTFWYFPSTLKEKMVLVLPHTDIIISAYSEITVNIDFFEVV